METTMDSHNPFRVWSTIPLLVMAICQATTSFAAPANDTPFEKVFFSDDFSGSTLGEDWGSWKSESVVRDGVLVGITPRDADHPSVNSLTLPNLSDLEVALKFKFAGSNRFSLMFRDLSYKGSHAGHICHVSISPTAVVLNDGKTGIFRKDIRDRRQAGEKLDEQTRQMLATRTLRTPVNIDPDTWHTLLIRIQGDHLRAWVDTVPAGDLQAPGIAHPTKSNMNITTVDREVFYDDFSIRIP
jgi:hypothetical protein